MHGTLTTGHPQKKSEILRSFNRQNIEVIESSEWEWIATGLDRQRFRMKRCNDRGCRALLHLVRTQALRRFRCRHAQ